MACIYRACPVREANTILAIEVNMTCTVHACPLREAINILTVKVNIALSLQTKGKY